MQQVPEPTPISPEQLRELTAADERAQRFAFALKLAAMNGYGLAIVAVVALVSDLSDVFTWLLAAVLGVLAYLELRGRRLLASYDRNGLTLLVANQVALFALVCIYSLGRICVSLSSASPLTQLLQENAGMADALASTNLADNAESYYRYGISGFYLLLIAMTAIFQGACAAYYLSRRRYLEEFLSRTPAWLIEWKRSRGGVPRPPA